MEVIAKLELATRSGYFVKRTKTFKGSENEISEKMRIWANELYVYWDGIYGKCLAYVLGKESNHLNFKYNCTAAEMKEYKNERQ